MPSKNEIVREVSIAAGLVTIRDLRQGDAPAMLEFINALSEERTFVLFQGEQLSLEQEEAWLEGRLAEVIDCRGISLGAFLGTRAIGSTSIIAKPLAERHVGVFGLSVSHDFRGLGLGAALMDAVIEESEKRLQDLRIIELGVFASNELARKLYESRGFEEFGILPAGVQHRNEFVDHVLMYRTIDR